MAIVRLETSLTTCPVLEVDSTSMGDVGAFFTTHEVLTTPYCPPHALFMSLTTLYCPPSSPLHALSLILTQDQLTHVSTGPIVHRTNCLITIIMTLTVRRDNRKAKAKVGTLADFVHTHTHRGTQSHTYITVPSCLSDSQDI